MKTTLSTGRYLVALLALGSAGWAMQPLSEAAMATTYGGKYTDGKECVTAATADCYPAGYDKDRTPACQSVMLPQYSPTEDPNHAPVVRSCVVVTPQKVKRCTGTATGKRCSEPTCTKEWNMDVFPAQLKTSNCQTCSTIKVGWGTEVTPGDPNSPLNCQDCTGASASGVYVDDCLTQALPPA